MRAALAVLLSVLVALLPITANAAPSTGVVQGTVTVSGRPLDGAEVALVDIASGAIHRTRSTRGGSFKVTVPAGQYVIANRSTAGLAVAHAPAVVAVEAGKVASTQIDLVALAVPLPQPPPPQAPPPPGPVSELTITPYPIDCIREGEHPILWATIEPTAKVARARGYFKSGAGKSNEWYYGEATFMTADAIKEAITAAGAVAPDDVPPGGAHVVFLPKATVKANPITFHWLATTPDLTEKLSPDQIITVVAQDSDCKGRVAPIALPSQGLTFFSATTGAAVSGAVLGAGGLLGAGAIIALIAVAAGAGIAAGVAAGGTPEPPTTTTPPVNVCGPGACPAGNICTVVGGSPVCTAPPPANRCEPNPCPAGQICNQTGPTICTEPPPTTTLPLQVKCTECATPPCRTEADEVPICPPPAGCKEPPPGVCPCPAVRSGCPK